MSIDETIRLIHITTVPQSLGFLHGQAGFLKTRGFEIHAISSPGAWLSRFAEREQVEVHAVDMPRRITPLRDLAGVYGMWKAFNRIRPHIVHAHTPKGGLLGMVSAWLARVPLRIYHMHGLPFMTATGWKRRLLLWSEQLSCALAHRVLCVSASVRQVAIDSGLCRPDKITVLARGSINGVDASHRFNDRLVPDAEREEARRRYDIPPQAPVVGFIGRIVRDKGITELACAWDRLRRLFPDLHLVLVGPHEAQDPIPIQVDRVLREDPRVHFVGEEWNTPPLYAIMDLLILPTYREGFPTVVLEAAGMRVPVVATQVPGCVDAVHDGVTGLLVPPYDAGGLAGAVGRYLQDPDLRRRHGSAARDRVLREFRPDHVWQAMYQEYVRGLRHNGVKARRRDSLLAAGMGPAD